MLLGMCLRLLKIEFVLSIPDYPCCHRPSLHVNLGELRNHQFGQSKKVVNFILALLNPYPTTEPIHSSQNDTPIANVLQFQVASSKDHTVAQWAEPLISLWRATYKNLCIKSKTVTYNIS